MLEKVLKINELRIYQNVLQWSKNDKQKLNRKQIIDSQTGYLKR